LIQNPRVKVGPICITNNTCGRPKMTIRKPTLEEFLNFDVNRSSPHLWENTPRNWLCPSCGRSKYQIMRWSKRLVDYNNRSGPPVEGWAAPLVRHHDHSQGYFDIGEGRFQETIICGDCNSVDGSAKRKFNIPCDFSFTPIEISQFVTSIPHGTVEIHYEIAHEIWKEWDTYMATNEDDYLMYAH
jgi:hypothetical protein